MVKEWNVLVENVLGYVDYYENGPVVQNTQVKHDESGNVVAIRIPTNKLRNEAKILQFNWKTLNTDVVVKSGDNVIIGHTNDFTPGDNSRLFKIEIPEQPTVWMVFSMGCPSIGLNANGMVFSGNQVDANDTRSGIPRSMLFMEGMLSRNLEEAKKIFFNKLYISGE